ncbi:hypothetical protein QVD17_28140 [Tagetes erecta]|uniref:Uncharacterized protein n=1 Tax=Tagetes erecta TaxID=13708 RepID=A0AAD8KCT5_TARER|nr:hypothetical protein QVD17_28140 [Tagetes erecta]
MQCHHTKYNHLLCDQLLFLDLLYFLHLNVTADVAEDSKFGVGDRNDEYYMSPLGELSWLPCRVQGTLKMSLLAFEACLPLSEESVVDVIHNDVLGCQAVNQGVVCEILSLAVLIDLYLWLAISDLLAFCHNRLKARLKRITDLPNN